MTAKQRHTQGPKPRLNARHQLTMAHHDLNTARVALGALRAENARLRALVDRIVPGDPLWPEARAALKVAA